MHLKSDIQPNEWNIALREFSSAHVLQTWEWGQAKSMYGWRPFYKLWVDETDNNLGAALILERALSTNIGFPRLRILYVPKGPILDWDNESISRKILGELIRFGKKRDAVFIKIDPDVDLGFGIPDKPQDQNDYSKGTATKILKELGWVYSKEQIQFKNSVVLNLNPSLDDLLGNMKQKTRYNIRLAGRKGIEIREGTEKDFSLLFEMYSETSVRDDFVIRNFNYYKDLWTIFFRRNMAIPLIAEFEGVPVAAIFLFYFDKKAWFLFGMSSNAHREKMPNYILQWAAISKAKALGCHEYDFWGAPDEFEPIDPMWGVYKFKSGFGGQVVRRIGAWDYVIRPTYYMLYSRFIPLLLNFMRKKSTARTKQEINQSI